MSTEQDQRSFLQDESSLPVIIKSTEFFPLCGQSGVKNERNGTGDVRLTDLSGTIRRTEVRIGRLIVSERICLGAGDMP